MIGTCRVARAVPASASLSAALHVLGSIVMVWPMRWILCVGCWCLGLVGSVVAVPEAKSVAILYNSAVPESLRLAEFYRDARGIPADQLIGLNLPAKPSVTRKEYDELLAGPLRAEFDKRRWWGRVVDAKDVTAPVSNKIQVLVVMRGVPLRILPSQAPQKGENAPDRTQQPFIGRDEAAVDSELAMLGVEGVNLAGAATNLYFGSEKAFGKAGLPFMMLTARIDAPSYATCERMITDAIEVEKTGLWGMCYVDIAKKFPQGDDWLEAVAKQSTDAGIPTVIDRFKPTLPTNYPMSDAAMYFGWYDRNVSGPFLNPAFRFRKGAVAMHLHSYSAQQLRDPKMNWSGPLLERGAAVTIGNVFEPYLHMTHDFGIMHQRLMSGFSWVEACWMSIRSVSWQGVVLGDPLYRPFGHLDGSGTVQEDDLAYRALRAAALKWKDDPAERRGQLKEAAVRMKSGVILEALGLELLEEGRADRSGTLFVQARELYQEPADNLRMDLHLVQMQRTSGRKLAAVDELRKAETRYANIPEVKAVKGWLDILDPPPPPPAKPAGN